MKIRFIYWFGLFILVGCNSTEDYSFKESFLQEIIRKSQAIDSINLNSLVSLQSLTKDNWDSVYVFTDDYREKSIISELKEDGIVNPFAIKDYNLIEKESYILVFTKKNQINFTCTIFFNETLNGRKLSFLGYNRNGYYMSFSKFHKSEADFYVIEKCINIDGEIIREYDIMPKFLFAQKTMEYWKRTLNKCW